MKHVLFGICNVTMCLVADSVPVKHVLFGICNVTMCLVADSVPVKHVLFGICNVTMCLVADSVPVKHVLFGICNVTMCLVADSVPVKHVLFGICNVTMCLVADSVPVKHVLFGICNVTMCLVADSVPVEHVLSGVHYVTTMDVSCFRFCSCQACSVWCSLHHNDGRVLFQVLFLSSMFCLVFITSQRWTCLVSGSVLVKHVLSGVHYVTTMDVSCFRFCSCQACSVWCSLRHNDGRVLFQVLFLSSMFCLVFSLVFVMLR